MIRVPYAKVLLPHRVLCLPLCSEIHIHTIGSYEGDAWPNAIAFDASESNFNRVQLCAGFRDVLLDLNDPRIAVWFNKVRVPIKVSIAQSPEADIVVDGIRYVHPDSMGVRNWVVYN